MKSLNNLNRISNKGLTLIELLLVITLLGILSAVLVGIIDPQRQRDYAEDGVLRANLTKACAGIEAYYHAENEVYPEEGNVNNPLDASAGTSSVAAFYIDTWPTGFVYNAYSSETTFSLYVQQAGTSNFYKCNSAWKNVRECAETTADIDALSDCDPV